MDSVMKGLMGQCPSPEFLGKNRAHACGALGSL